MPGMSGLELQKELTARGIDLPTIIVTGFADVRIAVEAMKAGAVEFLEKPFRTQELCDHIQKAIKLDVASWQQRQAAGENRAATLRAHPRRKTSARLDRCRQDQSLDGRRTGPERPHHRGPPGPVDAKAGGQLAGGTDRVGQDGRRRLALDGRRRRRSHAGMRCVPLARVPAQSVAEANTGEPARTADGAD